MGINSKRSKNSQINKIAKFLIYRSTWALSQLYKLHELNWVVICYLHFTVKHRFTKSFGEWWKVAIISGILVYRGSRYIGDPSISGIPVYRGFRLSTLFELYRKTLCEIDRRSPLSRPPFWLGFENYSGACDGHAQFPAKSGKKLKSAIHQLTNRYIIVKCTLHFFLISQATINTFPNFLLELLMVVLQIRIFGSGLQNILAQNFRKIFWKPEIKNLYLMHPE